MQTESGVGISDAIIALVACITLIVTAFVILLGLKFSRDSTTIQGELADLRSVVDAHAQRVFGVRATASTLAKMLSNSYAALDIIRRSLENVNIKVWQGDDARLQAFIDSISVPLDQLSRIEEYLRLLNPVSPDDFSHAVSDYVDKFPDENSVEELLFLSTLLPAGESAIARSAARSLRHRIRGYDSFEWTGLHL